MSVDLEALLFLVKLRAEQIARVPEADREAALVILHGEHQRSGIKAGMTAEASLEMAGRLDTWIRDSLILRPDGAPPKRSLH